ncbi:MAG: Crp/Fnr family transcriptional regulator [Chloroflexi bacterium]|nr:Crp/Fnr family transcriptional regulator [Chloroflexota bacterium]
MTGVEALRKSGLFGDLSNDQIAVLKPIVEPLLWEAEEPIFSQGDPATRLYVLTEGSVELSFWYEGGPGLTGLSTVQILEPHEAFGWSALVEPFRYTLSAKASKRAFALALDAAKLRDTLRSRPDIALRTYRGLSAILASRLHNTWASLVAERGLLGVYR